jgi:hypothetical protein
MKMHGSTIKILHRVEEERNVLLKTNRKRAELFGHTLRRVCLLKHIIEGKIEGRIEVTGR